MEEIWKPVFGHDGVFASSLGRLRGKRGGILAEQLGRDGYLRVSLYVPVRKKKTIPSHRLVAAAFYGPPPIGLEVAHGNGQRQDNRPSNLRYATRAENHKDKDTHGTVCRGEKSGLARLTERDVAAIWLDPRTEIEIARAYKVSQSTIHGIFAGKSWRWLTATIPAPDRKRRSDFGASRKSQTVFAE